jgi:hypothetical protein
MSQAAGASQHHVCGYSLAGANYKGDQKYTMLWQGDFSKKRELTYPNNLI